AELGWLVGAASATATAAPRAWRRRQQRTGAAVRPPLVEIDHDLGAAEGADLVEGLLRSIGLTDGFADLLVVVGHAADLENAPHATAYDCGACGAHDGLTNAQLVARLLNDPDVRAELAARGLVLPASTVAVAALHTTTTDEVVVHREPALALQRVGAMIEAPAFYPYLSGADNLRVLARAGGIQT
ncbi:MAG: putative inorganic carbon transporter subunit DabA, partial [Chloroflexus sp.]